MYLANRAVARSVYLRQVQLIFPFELLGRDAELAELAAFCTEPDSGSYVWWQGPMWAGKTALMAWFVQHPPAGVRVVSFFITARFAGQSDRTAFLEVVLEQLAEVAGQPMPDVNGSNQLAWFGQLLEDAAVACEENNQRLVLVVDGLDEDQGVTSKAVHSIAALLPATPPPGMRVIVAGRPNPRLPADVVHWHPLQDKNIVRPLPVSPYAQGVRDDAERELDHLLDDQGPGRKLLGLVTVARGGLSRDDLVELSGESPRTVDKALRSVLGRTFHGRLNRWRVSAPPVFGLAHEELQRSAAMSLSRGEFKGLVDQLHDWADQYRQLAWPAETPEYLLRGYHRLVVAIGDTERMADLATDRARLDRMLDVSGGDAAALAEITAVQMFICDQDHPDLASMLNLAITREWLDARNDSIPPTLPAAWVKLGNPVRAEGMAHSVDGSFMRAQALSAVGRALADAGDVERAYLVALQADTVARSITDPDQQSEVLVGVAEALARAGEPDKAEAIARSISHKLDQAAALAAVARALVRAGDVERARPIAQEGKGIARSTDEPRALVVITETLVVAGDLDKAAAFAQSIDYPGYQARALEMVAEALARAGEPDKAEAIARSVGRFWQAAALAVVARALARTGNEERARQIAQQAEVAASSLGKSRQAEALGIVAEALATAGDGERARQVAQRAETIARSHWSDQPRMLAAMAEALADAGDIDRARQVAQRAEGIAYSITNPDQQRLALRDVAEALASAGDLDKAEAIARSITQPDSVWRAMANALARAGDLDKAEAIARSITPSISQVRALTDVAEALAGAGDVERARQIAQRAEGAADSMTIIDPELALTYVAEAFARAGEPDKAEAIARSITIPISSHITALRTVADALAGAGDVERARQIAQQAEGAARSITTAQQAWALGEAAKALASAGDMERARQVAQQAEDTARSMTDPFWQMQALGMVTEALVRMGDLDKAEAIACSMTDPSGQAGALCLVAEALAQAGNPGKAGTSANAIGDCPQADVVKVSIASSTAVQRSRKLLSLALAQTGGYKALLPLLAKVEPNALVQAAQRLWCAPASLEAFAPGMRHSGTEEADGPGELRF